MDPNIFKNASDKVKSTLSKTSSSLSPYLENDQNKLDMTATAKLKGKTFSFGISIESN